MTYLDWRRWGYISRLSGLRCGGPGQGTLNTENAIAQQQLQVAQQEQALTSQDRDKMLQLEQPLITQQTALASGDRNAALAAAMPSISQISSGYQGAKESIFNSVTPGAARDTALANLETQKAVGTGTAMSTQVQQAPSILANVGQGIGAFSLQELGASLSGYSGAAKTNQDILQSETAQQAAKLGVLGGLMGGAGGASSLMNGINGLTGGKNNSTGTGASEGQYAGSSSGDNFESTSPGGGGTGASGPMGLD